MDPFATVTAAEYAKLIAMQGARVVEVRAELAALAVTLNDMRLSFSGAQPGTADQVRLCLNDALRELDETLAPSLGRVRETLSRAQRYLEEHDR